MFVAGRNDMPMFISRAIAPKSAEAQQMERLTEGQTPAFIGFILMKPEHKALRGQIRAKLAEFGVRVSLDYDDMQANGHIHCETTERPARIAEICDAFLKKVFKAEGKVEIVLDEEWHKEKKPADRP
jgi:hypothetical protein